MRFNPDRPHAIVYGVPGVSFQQNGNYYRRDGLLVEGDPERDEELQTLADRLANPGLEPEVREALRARLKAIGPAPAAPLPAPAPRSPASSDAGPEAGVRAKVGSDDMRLAENKALKARLEIYGEPWQSVAHARSFLEGRGE